MPVARCINAKASAIVLDACNGAGSIVGPKLITALGAEVISINDHQTDSFRGRLSHYRKNLGDLCAAVKKHGADVGFAQDMDADRLAVVFQ